MKKKRLLFILVGVLVLVGASAAYAVTEFTDIDGSAHEASIIWAVDNGITIGYADGTFRPNNPTTRGQMTTFLNRFYNNLVKPLENGTGGSVSGCVGCHDDSTLITGKKAQWEHSTASDGLGMAIDDGLGHAGELYWEEGDRTACAGCHSGGTFSNRIAAGAPPPTEVTDAMVTEKTPIDCRACHKIHVTGTPADFALETVAQVTLFATPTRTYNGGSGNLCVQCHQARRTIPAPANSTETTVANRFNPHADPQGSTVVGTAGAAPTGGVLQGTPMMHYTGVTNTCVACHMQDADHTFEPSTAACVPCHGTRTDFDVGDFQSEVIDRLNDIGAVLATAAGGNLVTATGDTAENGLVEYNQNTAGLPKLVPTGQAVALWNYFFIIEDGSYGVHNPGYVDQLLDAAEAGVPAT